MWFGEYLVRLPKDFRCDATSFWQRTLDAYKMVCFFLGSELGFVFVCMVGWLGIHYNPLELVFSVKFGDDFV